jgi:hypothetical protein
MSRPTLAIARATLGLAQGAALYLLYYGVEAKVWPATGLVFAPLVLTAVFIPTLALAGLGNLRLRNFAIWIAAATIVAAALGVYDVLDDPTGIGVGRLGSTLAPSPPLLLAVAVGFAITHTLVVSGDADRVFVAKYPRHFDIAWKHAVQVALAGAFVGALWILLLIGAALFDLIGIKFFEELLRKSWFSIPVTTLAFAVGIHVTDVQAGIVRGVRTVALTLLSWLLPLFALIAIGFLAPLLFTGFEPLWKTQHATSLVLATAAALIVLINAAYQDGTREHPVALVLRGAALALTPLVAIAAYAVMLRVNRYGWTPERVIATACLVVAACYALGYGLAAIASRPWLRWIETTNMATAMVVLAVIVALFSPVADPARIAVADQVARLKAGQTPVDKFDFTFLRFHGGRHGMAALDRLRQKQDGPEAARVAEKANAALAATALVRVCLVLGPWVCCRSTRAGPSLDYSPPAASRWPSLSAFCFASRSSPVCWSTDFIDRRTLPRSSKPKSLTLTLSPSLTTSVVFCTRRGASWLMCTRPSREPKKFTKAPKSITLTTVPS